MALITLLEAQLAFGHVPLLDHAGFSLETLERVGLIGRNGTGKTTSVVRAVTGETAATVLQGFTIRNGPIGSPVNTYRLGGGMFIDHASPTIRDCAFVNNAAGYGGGIYGLYSYREVFEFKEYWSIGSGRSFALGAMHAVHGKAKSAREVAVAGLAAGRRRRA